MTLILAALRIAPRLVPLMRVSPIPSCGGLYADGKLHLGGAETAAGSSGYLEGAVEAARRISRELVRTRASFAQPVAGSERSEEADPHSLNAASLARFREWVAGQADAVFGSYRHRLNRGLAQQQRDQLTQRAVLGAIEEVYSKALDMLDGLPFDMSGIGIERGRSALTPEVQAPFRDVMQAVSTMSPRLTQHPALSRISPRSII